MTDHDELVLRAMETYGGGFVQTLAKLFRHADAENEMKMKRTFADYWKRYEEIAQKGGR